MVGESSCVPVCAIDSSGSDAHDVIAGRLQEVGLRSVPVPDASFPPEGPLLLTAGDNERLRLWLRRAVRVGPTFVMMVGTESDATRLQLLTDGAADVFFMSAEEPLGPLAARIVQYNEVADVVNSALVTKRFAGSSVLWRRALHELVTIARSDFAATLLSGETGTGKDGAARLIHEAGLTNGGEFVVVHCGAIVSTLSGSELFGHRRGAFSGADRDRDGAIARANGGTLFLDEVAELSPALQTELLRVLQDGTYRPVGDDRERVSRFRVVAATHVNLKERVARGAFREDLYFRLRAAEVHLPPLRARRVDVPELVRRFAAEFAGPSARVEPALERALSCHPFPGNVRELRSLVRAACARCPDGRTVRLASLPAYALAELDGASAWSAGDLDACAAAAVSLGVSFNDFVDAAKDSLVKAALGLARGSSREAAMRIRVSERCIQLRRRGTGRASSVSCGSGAEPLEAVG